jgi:hypothetical protein
MASPYEFDGLRKVVLDSCRVPWIPPPPISAGYPSKLDIFVEERLSTGEIVMRKVGKNRKTTPPARFYDRVKGRKLCFNALTAPPGVLDSKRFGLPVPRMRFLNPPLPFGAPDVGVDSSTWMYYENRPQLIDVGVQMRCPAASLLPTILAGVNNAISQSATITLDYGRPTPSPPVSPAFGIMRLRSSSSVCTVFVMVVYTTRELFVASRAFLHNSLRGLFFAIPFHRALTLSRRRFLGSQREQRRRGCEMGRISMRD